MPRGEALPDPRPRYPMHAGVRCATQGQRSKAGPLTTAEPKPERALRTVYTLYQGGGPRAEGHAGGTRPLLCDPPVPRPLSYGAESSGSRQPTDRAGGKSWLPHGSRGTTGAPWRIAQLLSSRGSVTRQSISTKRDLYDHLYHSSC